jgi:hypothetical protein
LSPQLSHVEQAERIAGWLATLETKSPVRVVLNTIEIGQPAAASFRVLRPRHFAMAKADAAEHLHSLLLAKLNNHSLRFADDLALRLGDLDCEHAGDARACAIGIWASTQGSSSEPLRL